MEFKRDCREFPGIYACDVMTSENYMDCKNCKFYEPIDKRILIIKLGAMGDVIRTTPLIKNIRKKYKNCHITWLVNKESKDLVVADRVLVYNQENILRLQSEEFDVLLSLEHDVPGSAIANLIKAKEKYGYYLERDGHPNYFNESARFYLERIFSNFVNKNNNRTYQDMMSGVCELDYSKEEFVIDYNKEYGNEFLRRNHLGTSDKFIGIHMGTGGRWPSKAWSRSKLIEFIRQVKGYKVILFAGPNEAKEQKELASGLNVYLNDPKNSVKEFVSLVNLCDVMVVNDSFALHVSVALKKKTIALFFCTPPWEIEDYGRVVKVVSPLLDKYFYTDEYVEELVNSISVEDVLKEV